MSDYPAPGLGPVDGPLRDGPGETTPAQPAPAQPLPGQPVPGPAGVDQPAPSPWAAGQSEPDTWAVNSEPVTTAVPQPQPQPGPWAQPLPGAPGQIPPGQVAPEPYVPGQPVFGTYPQAQPGPQPYGQVPPGSGQYVPGQAGPMPWPPPQLAGWQPQGWPPPRRGPSRVPLVLTILGLVAALLFAGVGSAAAAVKVAKDKRDAPAASLYLSGVVVDQRNREVSDLLARRSKAVREKDKAAFLADVDPSQPGLVAAQTLQYENLVKLPFAAFSYTLETDKFRLKSHADLVAKYKKIVFLPAVTIHFRIEGVDDVESATPYVPIFGRIKDKWTLVGEAVTKDLDSAIPFGFGTQPWQGDAISVRTTANAVLVYSPSDESKVAEWSNLIENSIRDVKKFRPDGWSGKVYAIAVRDKKLYNEYMGEGKGDKFSAFQTARYDRVGRWSSSATPPKISGSLVMINPDSLGKGDDRIESIMTHEITHVAMQPIDNGYTPSWLVEGTAEFVESGMMTNMQIKPEWAKEHLAGKNLDELPYARTFYDDNGENYTLAWLACMMIADKYGRAKLLALYLAFKDAKDQNLETRDKAMRDALGVSLADFTTQWRNEVKRSINGG
ncbi:hypothetical protein Lfu02_25070 [Longispora fulva]|uniref:Peptidase MA-like domain-containing protein n=1 Tax=Longispora fulva TaxID=619741 RepID=A0A8J7KSC9_9ACTN|nr:hypothetical protein [Longispora fulva]MBG6139482.1 hypothetical protein [Longispora fulva]GIG58135.1 hypothetical protein Lfu02_25070 [Longispora fulva]